MKLINRGFLMVKPKQAFIDWVLTIDPELLIDLDSEGSLYLIEEEFWDDDLILQKYLKQIWQQECAAILTEEAEFPDLINKENMHAYFHFDLGCTVIDFLSNPITREAL